MSDKMEGEEANDQSKKGDDQVEIINNQTETPNTQTASVQITNTQTANPTNNQSSNKQDQNLRICQRLTLFVAMVTSFVFPFAASSLNVAIPSIGQEFHAPATMLTWIISALMLTHAALGVPIGRFADLFGKRRILNAGILLFLIACLACAFAPNMPVLIALRVFQGIAGAMIVSTNMAILVDTYPANRRGQALGFAVMSTYSGLSLGPVIGGFITHYFGWRAIFILMVILALAVFIVAIIANRWFIRCGPTVTAASGERASVSPVSIILFIFAMLCFMYGFTTFSQHIYSYVLVGAGVILFIALGFHELRSKNPLIEVRLFKGNMNFVLSNVAALANYAAMGALGYILAIYLEAARGFGENITGLILIAQPVLMAALSPLAGKMSDRISPFRLSTIGMAFCALSMFMFLFLGVDTPLFYIIICLLIAGIGFGLFSSPNTNAVMQTITPRDTGVATSILNSMRSIGQISSMAIITIIMHLTLGDSAIEEAGPAGITGTMNIVFIVCLAICIVGILLSFGRKSEKKSEKKSETV